MKITDVANYILYTYGGEYDISPLKLQKLLFYVKVWTLVAGNPLIKEQFEKWDYGPVNKHIYQLYKKHNSNPIPVPDQTKNFDEFIYTEKEIINFIVENYIDFSPFTLSQMTHSEAPWLKTEKNCVIEDAYIKSYYSEQPFAKNFPLGNSDLFYPVITSLDNAFILDMSADDRIKTLTFDSFENYKKLKKSELNKIANFSDLFQ